MTDETPLNFGSEDEIPTYVPTKKEPQTLNYPDETRVCLTFANGSSIEFQSNQFGDKEEILSFVSWLKVNLLEGEKSDTKPTYT